MALETRALICHTYEMGTAFSAWDGVESPRSPDLLSTPGADRDRTADARDASSDATDDISRERDDQAELRDNRAEAREAENNVVDFASRSDRAAAKRDRQASATDRTHALHDRVSAGEDRILSSRERSEFLVDDLTGAHRRSAGLLELEREATRAQRTGQAYSMAFIDVDGLKGVNDSMGHAAGDELLVKVVETLRSRVRPYDLVVRYGGDEFLCGLLDMDLAEAERRVGLVNDDLSAGSDGHVTAGLARLEEGDTLAGRIRRADDDLYLRRRCTRSPSRPTV
jgi:diguanylate cyclase (GGDEF)-like protein